MALPVAFDNRIKEQLQDEYNDYIACFNEGMYHGIRVNTNKISVEDFLKICPFELTPVPWTKNGFYYDEKTCTPSKHPYYYAGLYYIQEPSAMTPASVLDIEAGDIVLDICAAPGGKSTELAAKLHGTGFIISNDISNSRAKALLKNMELFGIGNMCVVSEAPNTLSKSFYNTFDKILVDAPCSGEGMFRKSASMMTAWENNGVELFAGLQRGILNEVVKMLKPGGTMLYSTCTFSPEENEQSIEYLLSLDDSLELLEVPKYEGFRDGNPAWGNTDNPDLTKCARLWPHHVKGEGHFVSLIHKKEDDACTASCSSYNLKSYKPDEYVCDFFKNIDSSAGLDFSRIEEIKGRLYYISENMPDVKGLRLLRNGLFLGEIKKNRFEPSQSLAMYLKQGQFKNEVSFSSEDDRIIRYLKGETIELNEEENNLKNGYTLILVDGYPLGWAKNNNGTLKNKYLSGWRMMS
jgi:NOL1/NOP2/sun family putative RNA methylase